MYQCYDIEVPRLFVASVQDVEEGHIDPAIRPGFECFLSPLLDAKTFSTNKLVFALTQYGCAHVCQPIGLFKCVDDVPFVNAPFTRDLIDTYPFKTLAEKTHDQTDRDILFVCEDADAEEGSAAELFDWIYGEYHPYGTELVRESTLAFETPLGKVCVKGPDGPVPFAVTKLLNRHFPYGKRRTVEILDNIYELEVPLDGLKDYEKYFVGCEGHKLEFSDSDEMTESFTCVADGLAFGIGVFDPSEDYELAGRPPSEYEGYFVDRNYDRRKDAPIYITPVPNRSWIKNALLWVGWLENFTEGHEPFQTAEDLLDFYLT